MQRRKTRWYHDIITEKYTKYTSGWSCTHAWKQRPHRHYFTKIHTHTHTHTSVLSKNPLSWQKPVKQLLLRPARIHTVPLTMRTTHTHTHTHTSWFSSWCKLLRGVCRQTSCVSGSADTDWFYTSIDSQSLYLCWQWTGRLSDAQNDTQRSSVMQTDHVLTHSWSVHYQHHVYPLNKTQSFISMKCRKYANKLQNSYWMDLVVKWFCLLWWEVPTTGLSAAYRQMPIYLWGPVSRVLPRQWNGGAAPLYC